MLYRWIPIAIFSYLFSMFFVPRYTPFADRARSHAMFTMWDGNHQWRNVNPMSKNDEFRLLGLNLGLSRDFCEPMVGSAVKILDGPIKTSCFALFPEKHAACNGCFILMHYRCQIMCVCSAAKIHREIFEWAFTDGVTTCVNMWLCCRQAFIFWLIISTILQSDVYYCCAI